MYIIAFMGRTSVSIWQQPNMTIIAIGATPSIMSVLATFLAFRECYLYL